LIQDKIHSKGILTSWLQAGTSNQETINIWLGSQVLAVLVGDTSTIDDSGILCNLLANTLLQPAANGSMDSLSLLSRSNLSGTNGPDWLISNNDLGPLLLAQNLLNSRKLGRDNRLSLTGLALGKGLAAAEDNPDAAIDGSLGLGGDEGVVLLEDFTALGVADQGPGDTGVLELVNGDLASVCAIWLIEDVLCGNLDLVLGLLLREGEIDGWWCNDDLWEERMVRN
jgi:hypothetical protein